MSAILTGLVLGFFAIVLLPDSIRQAWRSFAQTAPSNASSTLKPATTAVPAPQSKAAADASKVQAQAPEDDGHRRSAPPEEAVKQAPVLVPAQDIQFPKPFSRDEMSQALEPLLSFKINDGDSKAVKEAFEAASREDDADAVAAIQKIGDPSAKTFAEWRRLRQPDADFDDVLAFRAAHPLFPEPPQGSLIEKKLFLSDVPAASVLKFYTNRVPVSGAGHASLGAALIETGERERGIALIKLAWHRYAMDPAVEEKIKERLGSFLSAADDSQRARLLAIRAAAKEDKVAAGSGRTGLKAVARLRGKAGRSRTRHRNQTARQRGRRADAGTLDSEALSQKTLGLAVKSTAEFVRYKRSRVSAAKGKKVEEEKPPKTAQAKAAEKSINLAKEGGGGPATLLARLKALRREDADRNLWSVLRSINPDSADLADPGRWWDFRRGEIRHALSEDRPKTAYAIAIVHGPLEGENASDAEFLAGWIALRFLHDPRKAIPHFEASRVDGFARTQARAAYWAGRAKLELGDTKEAQAAFSEASQWYFTFYGGLAREAVRKTSACEFRAPPKPSRDAVAAFVNEDAFKAVMIAKQLNLDSVLVSYVLDLARQIRDPEQMTLLMELLERIAPPHLSVRAAKVALLRGFATDAYAYPVLLPNFTDLGPNAKLESALLHALTRQESEFFTGTVSSAGARGLMQLMPQTAKLTAASAKLKYEAGRLVSDPSYNVTLGSVFLAQLLSGYNGSYVLALAAYNAGPGRVSEWISDFGDPRDPSVDAIDWIERIPFAETRGYVQRILESTQLYRCRLENAKTRFQIAEDLHRGRPGSLPDFTDIAGNAGLEETK